MATQNLHLAGAELRRIVTKAEVIHRRRQVLALQPLRKDEDYAIYDTAGSTTILSPSVHGRKLNHTYGFGMFGPVTTKDLRAIELAYEAWDSGAALRPRPELDVCEYADKSTFDLLSKGYTVTGSVSQFQRYLDDIDSSAAPTNTTVRTVTSRSPEQAADDDASHEDFFEASVQGFRSGGRSIATLRALTESAVARSDTSLFTATIGCELVGTAVMAVIDVEGCKVASLFMDSCLEHAREKGVHKALLSERIRVAKEIGCGMVIAAAREGSGSARNIERAGLRKIFTCETYTKDEEIVGSFA